MFRLSTVGSRTFNVSGPRIWNGLPEDVVSASTFSSFRRRLKPFLFQQSYPDSVIWLYIWHYSGPCGDVYHLGHSKNHWTELNWTVAEPCPWNNVPLHLRDSEHYRLEVPLKTYLCCWEQRRLVTVAFTTPYECIYLLTCLGAPLWTGWCCQSLTRAVGHLDISSAARSSAMTRRWTVARSTATEAVIRVRRLSVHAGPPRRPRRPTTINYINITP